MTALSLIRHGATRGNLEKRYVGATDESLHEGQAELLKAARWPRVSLVFTSPMARCLETAAALFPDRAPIVVPDFRECDFGAFEYKNYAELNGDPDYQRYIDSGGEAPFPGGERKADFSTRCIRAFEQIVPALTADAALVVHGGTIMALMERFALPPRGYFDWQVKNGGGYRAMWDGAAIVGATAFPESPTH